MPKMQGMQEPGQWADCPSEISQDHAIIEGETLCGGRRSAGTKKPPGGFPAGGSWWAKDQVGLPADPADRDWRRAQI